VGFRAFLRPDISSGVAPELHSFRKKVADAMANEGERLRYEELMKSLQEKYMHADLEEMFIIMERVFPIPRPARILQSLQCETCGEMTMESRTRRLDGKTLCLACFEKAERKT
jgi:formylmethanofuran dehydrogenase subunit E